MTNDVAFEDAGSDEDLREAYVLKQWSRRRSSARARMSRARKLLATGRMEAAEGAAREALGLLRSALNWAEYGSKEEQAHLELDRAGKWVRSTFGCRLWREGHEYKVTCPVSLAHSRAGFSVGGAASSICSLCAGDLSECPQQRGRAYLVPGGTADLGWCRVCMADQKCRHLPTEMYRASVVGIVVEMDLEEVSIVSRPAHPDARIEERSVSHGELQAKLGWQFVPGIEVSCDRCLEPCSGLSRVDRARLTSRDETPAGSAGAA